MHERSGSDFTERVQDSKFIALRGCDHHHNAANAFLICASQSVTSVNNTNEIPSSTATAEMSIHRLRKSTAPLPEPGSSLAHVGDAPRV